MKKHPWYFIAGAVVIIAAFVIIYFVNKDPDYNVVDYFTEHNESGKITFMFIQIAEKDTAFMAKLGKKIMDEHPALKPEDGKLSALFAHFYNPADAQVPTEQVVADFKKKYPNNQNLIKKLDYIPKGYIYMGFSKDVPGLELPQNRLIQALVLAPKKGVRAEEIFKRNATPAPELQDTIEITPDKNIRIDSNLKDNNKK